MPGSAFINSTAMFFSRLNLEFGVTGDLFIDCIGHLTGTVFDPRHFTEHKAYTFFKKFMVKASISQLKIKVCGAQVPKYPY